MYLCSEKQERVCMDVIWIKLFNDMIQRWIFANTIIILKVSDDGV
jgi:hypothetical protein